MTDPIDVTGLVDLHLHCGPSPFDRRTDGYEAALEAARAGMDAIVLKEHHLPTVYGVEYIDRLLEREGYDIEVVGSTVLNYCNGGFNPFAVEAAIEYGAGVIWAPTIDAAHHASRTGDLGAFLGVDAGPEYDDREGVTALEDGELRRDVRLCLDKVVAHDVVFCVGHLSYEETLAIVEYLADDDHERVVVDHPNYHVTDLSIEQQRTLADLGAYMNFPFMGLSPKYRWISSEELYENIRALGIDRCVLSSDVGQQVNPSSPESMRILGETLRAEGLSTAEFQTMAAENPKSLLVDRE
ncbi:DUF6282 family protein [Natrinema gelatinilyticum]|uniref:DUF6282 family protein n=1 Tax=Natrinema gelatinilyticum TaxID=2961571 RepID=UPI0020C30A25|nr:DUF6282 family protein [Natrinema gelatinilyticum]